VLDEGEIVERGTHAKLLAHGGLYAGMWNRQREAEEAREKLRLAGEDAAEAVAAAKVKRVLVEKLDASASRPLSAFPQGDSGT